MVDIEKFVSENKEFFITDGTNVVHVVRIDDNTYMLEYGVLGKPMSHTITKESLVKTLKKRNPDVQGDSIYVDYVFSML